jgi:hypothetical protein
MDFARIWLGFGSDFARIWQREAAENPWIDRSPAKIVTFRLAGFQLLSLEFALIQTPQNPDAERSEFYEFSATQDCPKLAVSRSCLEARGSLKFARQSSE